MKAFIEKYLVELNKAILWGDEQELVDKIIEIKSIFQDEIPNVDDRLTLLNNTISRDANTLKGLLEKLILQIDVSQKQKSSNQKPKEESPVIFLSHSSKDKEMGNALRAFIVGLGVPDNQLIYTSHPRHGIPLNQDIYSYLHSKLNCENLHMIFLLSDSYFESAACLNEMGALWLKKGEFTTLFTPAFDFQNQKYLNCVLNRNQMGISLENNNDIGDKMIQLKNRLVQQFNLDNDERKTLNLITEFMETISKIE